MVRLSALYAPMIEAVTVEDIRHPYILAAGKSGQTMFQPTREDVRTMLKFCQLWAIDQELLTANQIVKLAGKPLVERGV